MRILIANWKMHKTGVEAAAFIAQLRSRDVLKGVRILIAPPFTAIDAAVLAAKGSALEIGAQNLYPEEQGAFTGEISAGMLCAAGATFAILGHSERRVLFGEQDGFICKKIGAAVRHALAPVLCIGESLEQRKQGQTESVLTACLERCLEGFSAQELSSLVLAYEPLWAIGTGSSATPEDAAEVHAVCRAWMQKRFSQDFAAKLPILYGGSVTASHLPALLAQPEINGALVGGGLLWMRKHFLHYLGA